ncbi:MAG: sugar ABC transporter substrate-binding protein [Lachnospiraceae bacterium]
MTRKKLMSLMFVTVLAATTILAGCGNNSSSSDSSNEEEGGGVGKIVIFQSKVEITDQMEALAKDYQAETGVEVEVWGTTGDDYFTQVKTKLANNQGPTVFSLAPGGESDQMSAYLEDLSKLSFIDKIAEGMTDEKDGKVVGIPYTMEGFGLVYNKDAMDMTAITDTDSLIGFMEDEKAKDKTAFGLSEESYFLIGHILNTPFALQEKPEEFMDAVIAGEQTITDVKEFQEFAKLYAAIRNNSYNPLEVNYDKACGDLATGKIDAIHQGNWSASMFADYDMEFEMGLAALPLVGNDKLAVSVPTAWYVNSQADEAEKQAGIDFLEWLYTSETGEKYLMDEFGFIPVVEGMQNENLDVLSQEVQKYAEAGDTLEWATNYYPAGIVDVYLTPIAEKFFTTEMTEQELLEEIQTAFVEAGK